MRAYLDNSNHLYFQLEPDQTTVYGFEIGEYFSGTDLKNSSQSFLTFLRDQKMIIPSFRWDGSEETRFLSGLEPLVKPTVYVGDSSIIPDTSINYKIKFFDIDGKLILTSNVSAASDLEGLISNFDNVNGIKATIEGEKFYIWLDASETGAPTDVAYFTIEAQDDGSWGLIKANDSYVGLNIGEISAYLFDENGDPIDAFDTKDGVIDPFRIELYTDNSLFQIFDTINSPDNRRYGLTAALDREGRLLINTTGLYDTKTFILQDYTIQLPIDNEIPNAADFNINNKYYYISAFPVEPSATFSSQTLTITLYKPDGSFNTDTISVNSKDNLQVILNELNKIDSDTDGTSDLSASIDEAGKLIIKINDSDFNNFKIETNSTINGNFVSYLYTHLQKQEDNFHGIINTLSGYTIKRGDNRTAQAIADSATVTREALNYSTLQDYYSSIVGEVGSAKQSVKDNKDFLETLISQLKSIKESISGVSLDEEMTNLIMYQQAFVASAKVLTTVEDMFEALISTKR